MLSYQHLYHAGNAADVHKHALLAVALAQMTRKDKPLTYYETHAGRGLYDLSAPEAVRTGEAAQGIGRLLAGFPARHPYAQAVARVRARSGANACPGSPLVAASALRPDDQAHLCELHPQEYAALAEAMRPFANVSTWRRDGIAFVLSKCPPETRRGLVLIDPSYEVKDDYEAMPHHLYHLHRKWNVGVLMLWYPVLVSGAQAGMARLLDACNFPGALRHEVRFAPARPGHGMIGSGVFVVNAPFGLAQEAARLDAAFRRLAKDAPSRPPAPAVAAKERERGSGREAGAGSGSRRGDGGGRRG